MPDYTSKEVRAYTTAKLLGLYKQVGREVFFREHPKLYGKAKRLGIIPKFKGSQVCKLAGCGRTGIRRWGLCVKHSKWVERGHMTQELQIVKNVERPNYKNKTCKIPDCTKRPRRNGVCERHSQQMREGTLNLDGSRQFKKILKYSKDFKCFICGRGGKITKKLCKKHYEDYRKGFIDYDGYPTDKEKKRVKSYKGIKCKLPSCKNQARVLGFCNLHYSRFKGGFVDIEGKSLREQPIQNKGRKCKIGDCSRSAVCKGYCSTHYSRKKRGLDLINPCVNKGRNCAASGCPKPARLRGYCDKHHYRLMSNLPIEDRDFKLLINKNRKCLIENCGKSVLARNLCSSHYEKERKIKFRESQGRLNSTVQSGLENEAQSPNSLVSTSEFPEIGSNTQPLVLPNSGVE